MNRDGIREPFLKASFTILTLLVIIVNYLADALPINGKTTGEISDLYQNLFTPSPVTFSIWGLIYLFLLLTGFTILKMNSARIKRCYTKQMSVLYTVASFANIAWLLLWHYELIPYTVLAMLVLLLSLIALYSKTRDCENPLVRITFSIYLSWISIALIANITVLLVSLGINQNIQNEEMVTVIIEIFGMLLSLFFLFRYRDISFTAVTIWAYMGILLKHLTVFDGGYMIIINSTIAIIAIMLVSLVLTQTRNLNFLRKK